MKFKRKYRVDGESKHIKNSKRKNPKKYSQFVAMGGTKSGLFNISDKKTREFVREYKEFIPKREIYKTNRKGDLVAVSLSQRRKDSAWKKAYAKRQKRGKK